MTEVTGGTLTIDVPIANSSWPAHGRGRARPHGRAFHDFRACVSEVVDGGPEPVLGRAFGRTRGPAMTGWQRPSVMVRVGGHEPRGSAVARSRRCGAADAVSALPARFGAERVRPLRNPAGAPIRGIVADRGGDRVRRLGVA